MSTLNTIKISINNEIRNLKLLLSWHGDNVLFEHPRSSPLCLVVHGAGEAVMVGTVGGNEEGEDTLSHLYTSEKDIQDGLRFAFTLPQQVAISSVIKLLEDSNFLSLLVRMLDGHGVDAMKFNAFELRGVLTPEAEEAKEVLGKYISAWEAI